MNKALRSPDLSLDYATPSDSEFTFLDASKDTPVRRAAQLEVSRFEASAKLQAPASANGSASRGSTSSVESELFQDIGADIRTLASARGLSRPVSMNASFPKARPMTFSPTQEWEGYVVDVIGDYMVANLVELTGHDRRPSSTVEVPLEELNAVDLKRLRPGVIFRWAIGYLRSPSGTKSRYSNIVFRDLPQWTRNELKMAKKEAAEMAAYFASSNDESSVP